MRTMSRITHLRPFILILFILIPLRSQTPWARVDSIVTAYLAGQNIPGASMAVMRNGTLLHSRGYGFSDLENRVPAEARTKFRIASVSKPITAAAVMQLAERGRIDLDAPVQRYIPEFPVKQRAVTMRQLLGHRSGIRHYRNVDEELRIGGRSYRDLTEALSLFMHDTLMHLPGAGYTYTTFGYNVLGVAVERVTGMPFTEYVRKNIFDLAAMPNTVPDRPNTIIPFRTRPYSPDSGGTVRNADVIDPGYKVPGGGFLSTAEDLVRFGDAMMTGRLVRPETFAAMSTPQRLDDGTATVYGLGWDVGAYAKEGYIAHRGGQQGATCVLLLFPSTRSSVMLLTNMDRGRNILETALEVARTAGVR
ncbi:MAG: beta-lactamase family protein [Bacteroidetes bacterium]|nr:MAG: beta-lactamase family protein [Bacteroidota bacterium]